MRTLITLLLLVFSFTTFAQKTLTEEDLIAIVKRYHPVARQAFLDVRIADANVTASRGAFDPLLSGSAARKEFEGLTYYDQGFAEIKIPTWYGIDIYAGSERIDGNRVNAEETKGHINYLGVSVPLMQNLLMDKRRAFLQQARIFRQETEVNRRAIINDLMHDALTTYWHWWQEFQLLTVIRASIENARDRFTMVKTAYELGDRPAIDTLEALTQVQFFEQRESEVLMYLAKAQLQLSTFLWTEETEPYMLPEDVIPAPAIKNEQLLLDPLLNAANDHPELLVYDFKLRSLEIERRLKFQALLPEVDLKYNRIGRDVSKTLAGQWFNNNYQFGISVAVPLRLSEGRGGYQAARFKIQQTRFGQINKQVQLENKVKQYYTEWVQTNNQLNLQRSLVENYLALQRGEEVRFFNGESSMFLINSREIKTIEGQQKQIELEAKVQRAIIDVRWAAGLFAE